MPTSEAEWRSALAAVHPDRGGDATDFIALTAQRDRWRQEHCFFCKKPLPRTHHIFMSSSHMKNGRSVYPHSYCNKQCAARARAEAQRKPKKLKGGRVSSNGTWERGPEEASALHVESGKVVP